MRLLALALMFAATHITAAPSFEQLRKDIYWLPGAFSPGRQPDGNTILIRGRAGWVVIDTGRHADHTQRILEFVDRADTPIVAVVNTHWHLDHVSGNPLIKRAFPHAQVHASIGIENAMSGFLSAYRKELQAQIAMGQDESAKTAWQEEIARIDAGAALFPDAPIMQSATAALAGRELAVNLAERTVTEGDVWLYDAATRVLIAGDLVTLPAPFLDTACPSRWRSVLADLPKTDFRTLIPGHGKPMSRAQFNDYRRGFNELLSCAESDAAIEQCSDQWLHSLGDLISETDHAFTRDLLAYYVGEVLRGDAERIAKRCAL